MIKEEIDFKVIYAKVTSRWLLFLVSFVICYITAEVYLNYSTPIYKVSTTILIKDDKNAPGLEEMSLFREPKPIGNEMALLQSFDMVAKTIEKLDFNVTYLHTGDVRDLELYHGFPYSIVLDSGAQQVYGKHIHIDFKSLTTFRLRIGDNDPIDEVFSVNTPVRKFNLNFTVVSDSLKAPEIDKNFQWYFVINHPEQLVQQYVNKLSITKAGKDAPGILDLNMSGPSSEKLVAFLNEHAQTYIDYGITQENTIAVNTIYFIDEQLREVSVSLDKAETDLESFQKKHKVMDISSAADLIKTNLDELEKERSMEQLQAKYYDYLYKYLLQDKNLNEVIAPHVMGIDDDLLLSLIAELTELNNERNVIVRSSTTKNPYLKELDVKIT
ncbi:MAG: hypothetical protein H7259_10015, partial [Cytophagales bacterium]|nr:hypothetical protein [Cytophaga sp.]